MVRFLACLLLGCYSLLSRTPFRVTLYKRIPRYGLDRPTGPREYLSAQLPKKRADPHDQQLSTVVYYFVESQ